MASYYTETENKLSSAIWELLEAYPFRDITVTMLCQKAHVGRRTFYRHFTTMQELIRVDFLKMISIFTFEEAGASSLEEMMEVSYSIYYNHRKQLTLLQKNSLLQPLLYEMRYGTLFRQQQKIFMERTGLPDSMWDYVANTIASTHSALILTWASRGFKDDPKDLMDYELSMFSLMADPNREDTRDKFHRTVEY